MYYWCNRVVIKFRIIRRKTEKYLSLLNNEQVSKVNFLQKKNIKKWEWLKITDCATSLSTKLNQNLNNFLIERLIYFSDVARCSKMCDITGDEESFYFPSSSTCCPSLLYNLFLSPSLSFCLSLVCRTK